MSGFYGENHTPNTWEVKSVATGLRRSYPFYTAEEFDRWLAEHDREVRVDALRKAAAPFFARLPDGTGNGRAYNGHQVAGILHGYADDEMNAVADPQSADKDPR